MEFYNFRNAFFIHAIKGFLFRLAEPENPLDTALHCGFWLCLCLLKTDKTE